jgi:hypothetical protein
MYKRKLMSKCAKETKNRYKTGEQKRIPDKLEKDESGYSHNRISAEWIDQTKIKIKIKNPARGLILVEPTVLRGEGLLNHITVSLI